MQFSAGTAIINFSYDGGLYLFFEEKRGGEMGGDT